MGRVVIFKEKTAIVDGKERIITKPSSRITEREEGTIDSRYGAVSLNVGTGSVQGKDYSVIPSSFSDDWKLLERGAQIITEKDIGLIIATTGIGASSIVGDAGSGSGALACALANICKKVHSYDIEESAIQVCKRNATRLGLKNISFTHCNIIEGLPPKKFDVFILDLQQSWNALGAVLKSIKIGGWIVSYNSSIPSVSEFVNTCRARNDIIIVKTSEVLERKWKIRGLTARPLSDMMHTGFLTFARKIA